MKLVDHLAHLAAECGDKVAVACGDSRLTYAQLLGEVRQMAAQMKNGGRLAVFRASQSADFLVRYLAVHMAERVAVPLESGCPDALVADVERQCAEASVPDGIADVLFTTGTTGKPKGVMISHSTIVADAENLIGAQGYHSGITFIVNGPLNHIGSLSKVYPTILVGGTTVIVNGMRDLDAFFRAIDSAPGPVATFLVPSAIRMLLAFAADRLAGYAHKIEFIETGAAPIAEADMQRLCEVLPSTRLYNTYASTETGIIATFDYNAGECLAGCLGRPMRHSRLIITADGHIACSGKTLMSGYLGDEALTQTVLRDGVLYTSDLGHIDEKGRLRLTGRDGDVINVGGFKVVPTEVEAAAAALPQVADCICIEATHRVLGTVLKLLVVTAEGQPFDKRAIARALAQRLEPYKVPTLYEQVPEIKRTFNGKINRKAYRNQ